MSVGPLTGESNSAMSTEDTVAMKGSQAPAIGTGPTKRAKMEIPVFPSRGTDASSRLHGMGRLLTAVPPISRKMVQHGVQRRSGGEIETQLEEILSTAQPLVTMQAKREVIKKSVFLAPKMLLEDL